MLRFFHDENVIHVNDRVDPNQDLEILNQELILADLQTLEKQKEPKKNATKEEQARWGIVNTLKRHLDKGELLRNIPFSVEEAHLIKPLNLLTIKPAIYVANLDEQQLAKSREELANFKLKPLIGLSAKIEAELAEATQQERQELLQSIGITEPALNTLAKVAYKTLGLISFLTAGQLEVRAWTIQAGTKAAEAAGVIHTDFAKKFIKAEVVNYTDFVKAGDWLNSREKGLVRQEGRDYVMQEGEIVEFKIGS